MAPALQKKPTKRDLRIEDALANMSPYELSALEVRVDKPMRASRGMHPHHFQRDADHLNIAEEQLMELGREELLMREAEVQKKIVVKANNKDRVGLTSVELSYLHQQVLVCSLYFGVPFWPLLPPPPLLTSPPHLLTTSSSSCKASRRRARSSSALQWPRSPPSCW